MFLPFGACHADRRDAGPKRVADIGTRQAADSALQGDNAGMLRGKPGVGGDAPFHGKGGRRVKLAIYKGMDHESDTFGIVGQSVVVRHDALPNSDASRPRARASLDITVPIGTASMADISR
ncbi:hypothetical protein MesoLj113a_14760 [Mesorhizobium sp. 113-1-2]|nr:Putative uncharacterized protein [Mesorhizobium loti]BCG70318.1 hypothetical protein MesoLj113a_14760 [Mesorhizobium sp. 113-1-2]